MNNQKIYPLVSIVTIVYNGAKRLEKTIESVIHQTYKNIEYIIIDGGSTDGTLKIIEKYEKNISFWVSEKDEGVTDAFNKGISKCTGSLIGLINADDWYELNAVENAVNCYEKADIIYGNMQCWVDDQKEYNYSADHNFLKKEMTINHMSTFVKPEVYKRFGLFKDDYKCAMDYELMLRFYVKNASFFYIPKTLSNRNLGGISDIYWKMGVKETMKAKIDNGVSPYKAFFYYFYHYLRSSFARLLQKKGGKKILTFYRKLFSMQKKSDY